MNLVQEIVKGIHRFKCVTDNAPTQAYLGQKQKRQLKQYAKDNDTPEVNTIAGLTLFFVEDEDHLFIVG